jgi:hypothetical protein
MGTSEGTIKKNGALQGLLSFLFAIATVGSVAMLGVTSFTAFNPPGWLRIATMAPLPLLVILSVGFGIAGFRSGSGRGWAMTGLILTCISFIAFIVMISVGG